MKNYDWMCNKEEEEPEPAANSNNTNSRKNKVEATNNRIYFYSEVTRSEVLTLNKYLTNLNINLYNRSKAYESIPPNIYLHINSFGGSVFAGFAAADYIKKSPIPIYTIIDGCAASAATLLSVVGTKRLMHENSFMLIHQLSSVLWGKYEEMKDDMKNNDLLMEKIKQIYIKHTKIPTKELEKILKRDIWWDAKTCLKYGLIDEII